MWYMSWSWAICLVVLVAAASVGGETPEGESQYLPPSVQHLSEGGAEESDIDVMSEAGAVAYEVQYKAAAYSLREAVGKGEHLTKEAEEQLVRDVLSVFVGVRHVPRLRRDGVSILQAVLLCKCPRDPSTPTTSLTPCERVQLMSALVMARVDAEAAKQPLFEALKRSPSPIVWARLGMVLPDIGMDRLEQELDKEELQRRKTVRQQAETVARPKLQEALDELHRRLAAMGAGKAGSEPKDARDTYRAADIAIRPETGEQIENLEDFLDAIRGSGALSALVGKKERDELCDLFVAMLLRDPHSVNMLWPYRGFGSVRFVHEAVWMELRDMAADCPALERLGQLREIWRNSDNPDKIMREMDLRAASLTLARHKVASEKALGPLPPHRLPGKRSSPS